MARFTGDSIRIWDVIGLLNDNSPVNVLNTAGDVISRYDGKNNIADEYNDLIITGIRHTPQAIELLTECDEYYIL